MLDALALPALVPHGPSVSLGELWSPSTDRGVAIQVAVTIAIIAALVWAVRRERSLVLFVLGVGALVLAWYGARTLH